MTGLTSLGEWGLLLGVVAVLAAFGFSGFRRGIWREIISLVVMTGGFSVITRFWRSGIRYFNGLFIGVMLVLRGGLARLNKGDIEAAADILLQIKRPITSRNEMLVKVIVWLIIVSLSYLFRRRLSGDSSRQRRSVVGAALGILNGWLFLLTCLVSMPFLMSDEVQPSITRLITMLLLVGLAILWLNESDLMSGVHSIVRAVGLSVLMVSGFALGLLACGFIPTLLAVVILVLYLSLYLSRLSSFLQNTLLYRYRQYPILTVFTVPVLAGLIYGWATWRLYATTLEEAKGLGLGATLEVIGISLSVLPLEGLIRSRVSSVTESRAKLIFQFLEHAAWSIPFLVILAYGVGLAFRKFFAIDVFTVYIPGLVCLWSGISMSRLILIDWSKLLSAEGLSTHNAQPGGNS